MSGIGKSELGHFFTLDKRQMKLVVACYRFLCARAKVKEIRNVRQLQTLNQLFIGIFFGVFFLLCQFCFGNHNYFYHFDWENKNERIRVICS